MSAGVSDQRMKGQGNQVPNGSKEQIGSSEGAASTAEEFEPWRAQQQNSVAHTAYGTTVPISSATDIYNMNSAGYYGSGGTYPYQTYGVGDGTWSNGTDMTFLGGYAAHDSYSVDGMFGPSTQFSTATYQGQPSSFNYFPSNGDYGNWGNQLSGPRKYDEYYRDPQQNLYSQAVPDNSLKSVEHAMQNLELKPSSDTKDQQKKATWASIASQPAKPQINVPSQGLKKKGPGMPPGPIVPGKHNIDIGTWETNKSLPPQVPMPIINNPPPPLLQQPPPKQQQQQQQSTLPPSAITGPGRPNWPGPPPQGSTASRQPPHHLNQQPPHRGHQQQQQQPSMAPVSASFQQPPMMTTHLPPPIPQPGSHHNIQGMILPPNQVPFEPSSTQIQNTIISNHPVLEKLKGKNNYNPPEFDLSAPSARFFVIKSYSEDDIHRSIKYEIWCSTEHGNKRLDQAFREREGNGCLYLFFSVNGSGHFCGMAQMISAVDYHSNSSVWSQDKWKGQFKVRWIYVKDVPNVQLRHIQLENNDNKPVTNSRDAQEVPHARGLQVLRIMHSYRHSTSIFDDFIHYEKRQEEEDHRKVPKEMMGHHSHPHSHQQPHHHQSGGENRGGRGGGGGGGGADHHQQQQQQHRGGEIVRHHERDAERNEGYHPHRGGGGGGGGHRGGEREERHHHLSGGAGTGGHNNNNRDRDNNRGRGGGGRNNGPRN